jgi:hypothetical protein
VLEFENGNCHKHTHGARHQPFFQRDRDSLVRASVSRIQGRGISVCSI